MARQWSATWSHSLACQLEAYRGSGWWSRALVTNSEISFSGNWYGP